jgi:hypothetical protein
MIDTLPAVVRKALDALNNVPMDGTLSYRQTRDALLLIQHHVGHLLTHFPLEPK